MVPSFLYYGAEIALSDIPLYWNPSWSTVSLVQVSDLLFHVECGIFWLPYLKHILDISLWILDVKAKATD